MTPQEFLKSVIRPTLGIIGFGGQNAEQILLGTAIQESGIQDIQQKGGPALGYFQIEPSTHEDLWVNFLRNRFRIAVAIKGLLPIDAPISSKLLLHNPLYECAMARVLYLRCPGDIPMTLEDQAVYYKQFYNTPLGAATVEEYISNFYKMCGEFPLKI